MITYSVITMKDLTPRQEEILKFIGTHLSEKGFWPSIREIQSHFEFSSTNAVIGHLRALEKKAYLTRIPGQARTFQMTEKAEEFLPKEETTTTVDTENLFSIPLYGEIAAGYPDGVESGGEIARINIDPQTANLRNVSKAFALRVRGDSMINAGLYEGDTVIFEPEQPQNRDIVAALIDGQTTLKRFVHRPGHSPHLKAENPSYPHLHPVSELMVQGVARSVLRHL